MECVKVLIKDHAFQKCSQAGVVDTEARVVKSRSRSHRYVFPIALLFVMVIILFVMLMLTLAKLHSLEQRVEADEENKKGGIWEQDERQTYNHMRQHGGDSFEANKSRHNARRRNRRNIGTPNFYVTGKGVDGDGVFTWGGRYPSRLFRSENNGQGDYRKITIRQAGVYYLFARIALRGRLSSSGHDGPINQRDTYGTRGLTIKRDNNYKSGEDLVSSFVTQDGRGNTYGHMRQTNAWDYPIDSAFVSGLFFLDVNDSIYVSKPVNLQNDPKGEQYITDEEKCQFGGFLVESEW